MMTPFGTNLKNARTAKGWTQQQLANKTGIARHNIGAYEEGRAHPNIKTYALLCKVFGANLFAADIDRKI